VPQELLEAYIMDFTALEGRILHAQSQIHSAEELVGVAICVRALCEYGTLYV
jgi:hypothetical protein